MTPTDLLHELVSLLEIAIANEEAADKRKRRSAGHVVLTLTPEWMNRASELISASKSQSQSTGEFEMNSRDRVFGTFLLLRGRRTGEHIGVIQQLRNNREARQATTDHFWQRYQEEREAGDYDGSFLEYLMANWEEIFKFFLTIFQMFSEGEGAQPA